MEMNGGNQDNASRQSNSSTPSSSMPLSNLSVRIKQEPTDSEWGEAHTTNSSRPSSVPTATVQPEPIQKHQRLRYYGRKHVASPDTAVCEVCQGEFRGPDVLQIHKLCHFNTSHVCYVCDCYFANTEVLVLHMATNHRNLSTTTGNYKPEAERSFVCVICLQRFSSNKMLMKHQRTHTEKDEHYHGCKVCALDFIGSKALLAHLSSPRHKEMKVKIQSIFVCVDCRSIFATRDSYAMHMMMRAQSETCDKMEDDTIDHEATERKVMDLLRGSVHAQDQLQSVANTMAMNAMVSTMASNGLLLNNIVAQEITPDKSVIDPAVLPFFTNEKVPPAPPSSATPTSNASHLDATSVPLNLSTTTPTPPVDTSTRLECNTCCATFPSDDSLAMHKVMMHRQERPAVPPPMTMAKRNPTVSDLLRAQQQMQSSHANMMSSSQLMMQNAGMAFTCVVCGVDLESCDALAMHMMDRHANQDDTFPLIPDAQAIRDKVQKVYMENKLMHAEHQQHHLQQHQQQVIPIKPPTPAPSPADIRSKSTGVLDDMRQAEGRPEKRRLSLQEEPTFKKPKPHNVSNASDFSAICATCGQCFTEKNIFFTHAGKCSDSAQNPAAYFAICSFCKQKFVTKDDFMAHLKVCHRHNNFMCGTCGLLFMDEYTMAYHCRTHNHVPKNPGADQMQMQDSKDDSNRVLECKQCKLILPDTDALIAHAQRCHHGSEKSQDGNMMRGCPLCGWSTQEPQLYVQHMLLHNVNMEELDLADGKPNGDMHNGMVQPKQEPGTDPYLDEIRRSRRKPLASAKVIPSCHSPDSSDMNHMWSEGGSECSTPMRSASTLARCHSQGPLMNGDQAPTPAPSNASMEDLSGEQLMSYLMENVGSLSMCKHCKVVFTDRTMYHLHMGLHNRNDPWQCNLCGKATRDVHEFSSHVIHY